MGESERSRTLYTTLSMPTPTNPQNGSQFVLNSIPVNFGDTQNRPEGYPITRILSHDDDARPPPYSEGVSQTLPEVLNMIYQRDLSTSRICLGHNFLAVSQSWISSALIALFTSGESSISQWAKQCLDQNLARFRSFALYCLSLQYEVNYFLPTPPVAEIEPFAHLGQLLALIDNRHGDHAWNGLPKELELQLRQVLSALIVKPAMELRIPFIATDGFLNTCRLDYVTRSGQVWPSELRRYASDAELLKAAKDWVGYERKVMADATILGILLPEEQEENARIGVLRMYLGRQIARQWLDALDAQGGCRARYIKEALKTQ